MAGYERGYPSGSTVADALRPVVRALIGEPLPVALRFWDGSGFGPDQSPATVVVRSPRALRRLLYAPNELGLGRAYVAGELDVEGDMFALFDLVESTQDSGAPATLELGARATVTAWRAARELGALGPPLPPPREEVRLRGRRHSKSRDSTAIARHYDVSNDFYRLILGETMTYSCAYFASPVLSLDDAQRMKYDLICRKLALRPGMRLLDVGCGWGAMVLHAAQRYGARCVGITLSRAQYQLATERVAGAGLADQIDVRLQDYRDVDDGPFDAVSSIGMFEHVGLAQVSNYLQVLSGLLTPTGRLLNHAIARPRPGGGVQPRSFIERYVFPDSELLEVGAVLSSMHDHGLEVRDVEALREHYGLTLRRWVANLEAHWAEAERLVGPSRARIWRLYMAGCGHNFERGLLGVNQVLAVKPGDAGTSGMPATRATWLAEPDISDGRVDQFDGQRMVKVSPKP